jgi:hypothetical protein
MVTMQRRVYTLLMVFTAAAAPLSAGGSYDHSAAFRAIRFSPKESIPELVDTTLYASTIRYTFSAGAALPVGMFGKTGKPNSGYAKTGPLVTFEFLFPVIHSVFFTASIAYNYHKTDNDAFRSSFSPATVSSILGEWAFIWALPGIRYEQRSSDVVLFGGINYGTVILQSADVSISYPFPSLSSSAVNTRTDGFRLELGAIVSDLYSASVQYYFTRPHLPVNAMATREAAQGTGYNYRFPANYTYVQPIAFLSFVFGFHF